MKDLGLMTVGILLMGAVIIGIVSAGSESSDGSNTRSGVVVHAPLPPGASVEANRLEAPNGR